MKFPPGLYAIAYRGSVSAPPGPAKPRPQSTPTRQTSETPASRRPGVPPTPNVPPTQHHPPKHHPTRKPGDTRRPQAGCPPNPKHPTPATPRTQTTPTRQTSGTPAGRRPGVPPYAEISSYCQRSSKNPAAATLPGYRPLAGTVTSITAQSGSFAICRALFRLSNSRNVKPLFSTTYFFPFNGLG